MAFQYETDTAADVPEFFANLEALMVAAGWTVASGSGTTTIVFASTGELGTLTKLFVRIWRDGGNPERVYYRVQDNAGGTHFTATSYVDYLVAPGGGAIPFKYWITATKDVVIITFKAASYTGCYVGLLEPFALNPLDETMYMAVVGLHTSDGSARPYGRVLQKYDNTWDHRVNCDECTHEFNPNELDNSHALFGAYVKAYGDENYGQLLYCSGRISAGTGINAEDTITSGYPGATSEWIVFGGGGVRWAVATSAPLPVGTGDGANWAYTTGVAADINALQTALENFLTAKGWVMGDWPGGGGIDRSFASVSEAGGHTIAIRWTWDAGQRYWGGQMYESVGGAQYTAIVTPGNARIEGGDWPVRYYFSGDKDCFVAIVEVATAFRWGWYGMCKSFHPDPSVIGTEYMVAAMNIISKYQLRRPNGLWTSALVEWTDPSYQGSSPSLIDGTTFVLWPYVFFTQGTVNYVPWGTTQYLYRLSSSSLGVGDTVAIGAHIFMYIGGYYGIKIA